jgi:SHS2 domain-containing protein
MAEQTPHQRLKKRLEDIGVQVTITHIPLTHYTLRYSFIRVESDDASEALYQFLSELIKYVPVERAAALSDTEVEKKLEDFRIGVQQNPIKPETS